jgi:hypothetical protein
MGAKLVGIATKLRYDRLKNGGSLPHRGLQTVKPPIQWTAGILGESGRVWQLSI